MPRGNPAKLVPNSARTPQQRKEQAAKAGKASGAARRKQKSIREAINSLLAQNLGSGTLKDNPNVQALIDQYGLGEEDKITVLTAAAILHATISGSPQHAKLLIDMTAKEEEKPTLPTKITISFDDNSEETEV